MSEEDYPIILPLLGNIDLDKLVEYWHLFIPKECTCGKDISNSMGPHSSWCDISEEIGHE